MHPYKTLAQILLILSSFNLVFSAPVAREIDDAHNHVVMPVVVRNVAATSKERRQSSELDGTPSPSSPPPSPPDGSAPSRFLPPPSDGPMPLHSLSLSDGPAPLRELPSRPAGPATLAVSSPPSASGTAGLSVVPASDPPVPMHATSTSQSYTSVTHSMLAIDRPSPEAEMERVERFGNLAKGVIVGSVIILIAGGLLWSHRHELRHRTIDPYCSTAKGSGHPCPDY